MRPLRLRLEGFTCYRRPVEVDFQGLDLFAITGSTGAGKSSLVHGMTYALYGRVPGFGNEVKELIAQGSDHLQVTFEFAADGQRYVVTRRTSRRAPPHVQLFRITEDGTQKGLTDRARETEERVRALIGLDFEGFTRSVLLPQGQFHLFLAGEPRERRKVLAELLRLDIYEAVMRLANADASRCEQEAANLRRRLQEDFADATLAALADRKRRLRELESRAKEMAETRAALEEGRAAAASLAGALEQLRAAAAELAKDEAALAKARQTVEVGDGRIRAIDGDLQRVEAALADSPFRADLHRRLHLALTLAKEYEQALGNVAKLRSQVQEQEGALAATTARQGAAEQAAAKAEEERKQAEGHLKELQRKHAAIALRSGLKRGDPCPVCTRPLEDVPSVEHVALDAAERNLRQCGNVAKAAMQEAEMARRTAALAEQRLKTAGQQSAQAEGEAGRWRQQLASQLGVEELPPLAQIEAQWQVQEKARQRHEQLEKERQRLQTERQRLKDEFEEARAQLAALQTAAETQRSQVQRLEAEVSQAREALSELAREHAWEDVLAALERGGEPVALERRAAAADTEMNSIQQEIGAVSTKIERIQEGIKQAAQLRREESELTARGRLARELAGLLRADRFQAYVEEAALRVLAEDASRHLWELSRERYQFDVQRQEFLVIDHWNGDEKRSVRTLSGGETFLASLALALALAERLPDLGATGAGTALESLFLDEGFSNLDTETRSMVADALERLHQDGTRMVGIITHDRELAERMPSRITVIKSEFGSTLSAE